MAGRKPVFIRMRHLGNNQSGNPVADWICHFPKEAMRV